MSDECPASLRWRLASETDSELVFHVPFNGALWGEELKMSVHSGKFVLHSQCRLVTQMLIGVRIEGIAQSF